MLCGVKYLYIGIKNVIWCEIFVYWDKKLYSVFLYFCVFLHTSCKMQSVSDLLPVLFKLM